MKRVTRLGQQRTPRSAGAAALSTACASPRRRRTSLGTRELPEIVVSDTHSYSDLVFGILELLGISYWPALADLPDQKGWRINADADYGSLNTFARGKIDLGRVRKHWDEILRVIASIYTGTVRAYDVVTMLQRDRHPTALGEVYLNAAIEQLKAQGYPRPGRRQRTAEPFVRKRLGVHGTYSFARPDLAPGAIRDLRDPDAPDEEE